MRKQNKISKIIKFSALIIFVAVMFTWLVPSGFCEDNEYISTAQAVIATQDTQQIQNLLDKWEIKLQDCNPDHSAIPACQALFEAMELLQNALTQE